MIRKADYPLQKVTINLRAGDFAWLKTMHGRKGANQAIRQLVIDHMDRVTREATEKICLDPELNSLPSGEQHPQQENGDDQ